eukprot:32843_1
MSMHLLNLEYIESNTKQSSVKTTQTHNRYLGHSYSDKIGQLIHWPQKWGFTLNWTQYRPSFIQPKETMAFIQPTEKNVYKNSVMGMVL